MFTHIRLCTEINTHTHSRTINDHVYYWKFQGSGKETDCEFKFHEKGEAHIIWCILANLVISTDSFVAFESVLYPGHFLGVLDNGQVKLPVKIDTPGNYEFFDIKNAER